MTIHHCEELSHRANLPLLPLGLDTEPLVELRNKPHSVDPRGGHNRSPSPSPHGRTRMIVFPLRRSVGLKAATASSRVETLPMFVRSRPSRTRWTSSLNWARSGTTTKSIVRPPEGRASV